MRALSFSIVLTAALVAATTATSAGSVSLQWDPSAGASGYRVYYGTSAGNYTAQTDTGIVTQGTISNLSECATWYFAVKALDAFGTPSATFSNEVSGWARPAVTSVSPAAAERGRRLTLTIDGSNFRSGAALTFSVAGLTVHSMTVQSCNRVTADVTIGSSVPTGSLDVEIMNTDRSFGTRTAALQVEAAVAPTVAATAPVNGATQVPTSVQPSVTFSEPVQPASVLPTTVQLLDASGTAVPQAAGSPTLSADGRTATLRPASPLAEGQTYRLRVVGGATGVLDLAGLGLAATFQQATGFSTTADTTGPTISSVASADVTAASARIAWTTNEPADTQVFFKQTGAASYSQTPLNTALVTAHSVTLSGLTAGTSYSFHVRSADAEGNASTSPDATFTTTSAAEGAIVVEAEDGFTTPPVRVVSGAGAFDGGWVDTPTGSAAGSEISPTGTVSLDVYVPTSGTWTLWLRLYAPATTSDSWFESVDGAARQPVYAPTIGQWVWVAGRSYTLSAGLHTVEIGGREEQARVDRILLSDDPAFTPTAVPGADNLSPLPVATFTISANNGANTLQWTASPSSDHARTVIRYRSDGIFPRTPADGLPVLDQAGAPGSTGSYVHLGLTNGVTYSYAAFSLDAAENGSNPTTASGKPGTSGGKPGKVPNNRRK